MPAGRLFLPWPKRVLSILKSMGWTSKPIRTIEIPEPAVEPLLTPGPAPEPQREPERQPVPIER